MFPQGLGTEEDKQGGLASLQVAMIGGCPISPAEKVLVRDTEHTSPPGRYVLSPPDEPPNHPREKFDEMVEGVAGIEGGGDVWDLPLKAMI